MQFSLLFDSRPVQKVAVLGLVSHERVSPSIPPPASILNDAQGRDFSGRIDSGDCALADALMITRLVIYAEFAVTPTAYDRIVDTMTKAPP
jgi:hypothetical protein